MVTVLNSREVHWAAVLFKILEDSKKSPLATYEMPSVPGTGARLPGAGIPPGSGC